MYVVPQHQTPLITESVLLLMILLSLVLSLILIFDCILMKHASSLSGDVDQAP